MSDLSASPAPALPSKRQQSWGALISIIVIMLMIIVGAFYAWSKRIAEERQIEGAAAAAFDSATSTE